ncbi:MAG: DUF58 domain-containing protein [Cyanobacteriota bacterium]
MQKEIVAKIKEIQIKAKYIVTDVLSGEYESAFKGRGIEFSEVREYMPGDDIRTIDWNVTARMNTPFVKEFTEERELTIMILLDLSASQEFGSSDDSKKETSTMLSSIFSYLALRNNDKVGLIIFTDKVEKYIPAKKGKDNIWKIIKEILTFEPHSKKTDISVALDFFNKVTKKKSVVFIISDFISSDFEKSIKKISKRHDVTAIKIFDEKEKNIENHGITLLQDFETGEIIEFDSNNKQDTKMYKELSIFEEESLNKFFKINKIEYLNIKNNSDYIHTLASFFKKRETR